MRFLRSRTTPSRVAAITAACLLFWISTPAMAMKIQSVKSPGGIEAWLVEEHSVPLFAMHFAFEGGSSQDPEGKPGVAHFITAMLDEGAGELTSTQFQEQMEEFVLRMSFDAGKDSFYGTFQALSENRDKATDLLRLALTRPRFEEQAVERIKKQLLSSLAFEAKSPDNVAAKEWYATAFPGHPYGRPMKGTPESVGQIGKQDLETYHKRVFARDTLKVAVVGDIDAATLAAMLDKVFGALPAKASLTAVPTVAPAAGQTKVIDMNVPQSVVQFGLKAVPRKDKEFVPAFVLNHILGGGGFSSRLMEEVREKRGLAYSVYSYVQPFARTAIFGGGVATKNESIEESLDVIRSELKRMAEQGPTPEELAGAKSYLTGSYALRFDTSPKIAGQLLAIQIEDLGIGFIDQRNAQIDAVTMEDVRRVAKLLLQPDNMIVTVVGRPAGNTAKALPTAAQGQPKKG